MHVLVDQRVHLEAILDLLSLKTWQKYLFFLIKMEVCFQELIYNFQDWLSMNVSACFSSCRAWRFMWSTNTSAVLKFYPAAGGKFYVFFKKSAFHRSDRKTQKRNPKRTIESKPVNDCSRNLAYIIKIQQSVHQNIFYLNQRVLGIV